METAKRRALRRRNLFIRAASISILLAAWEVDGTVHAADLPRTLSRQHCGISFA